MKSVFELDQALEKLKENGFKYTKRREEILSYLIQKNSYVSAKDVYNYMIKKHQGISYDTVYRNLYDFETLQIVESTDLNNEQKFRFHSCQMAEHHHHFICVDCGKIKEIHMCPMSYFKEQLPGCDIESHRFEIYGKCERCNK